MINQEVYKHLLYCSLHEIRTGNNDTKFWNPLDWLYSFKETKKNKELANLFHNLAFFVLHDFKGFDEERFWEDLKKSKYPFYEKYRNIYNKFLNGYSTMV